MKISRPIKKDTLLTVAGRDPHANHGIVNPPVYHLSTVLFPTMDEFLHRDSLPHIGTQYGRTGGPTQFAFEEAVTAMHEGHKSVAVPSGLAAINLAMFAFLEAGDHVLVADTVYGPTRGRVCDTNMKRAGVEVTYYDPLIGAGIADLIRPETKIVYMESPGSHTFEMQDMPAIADAARKAGVLSMADNTWSSPYYCQPLKLGVDIVVEASTKYVVGHADAMLGTVTTATEDHFKEVKLRANGLGYHAAPDDCYLGLRGLRTLSVRMERHQKNGLRVAEWLKGRPEVSQVMYPALESDPGHAIWKRDHQGASSLFGVVLKGASMDQVAAMLDGMELFGMGASWGGFESLMIPTFPEKMRTANPWAADGPTVRLHIGLEDPDDVIADLESGLQRLTATG